MSNGRRFKISNTTIKPLKTDKMGRDIRPLRDRVGHAVQFSNPRNSSELVIIYPKRSVTVDTVTDGILGLYKKGLVGVTEVGDIADELKKLAFKKEPAAAEKAPKSKEAPAKKEEPKEEEMLVARREEIENENDMLVAKEEPKEESKDKDLPEGKSSPMGSSPDSEERLVYPDGEPNFIAKAPKGGMKKSRKKTSSVLGDE